MTGTEKQIIDAIIGYCGYGKPVDAEIFFMGIEEHKEMDEDTLKKLKKIKNTEYNYSYETICDDTWNPKSLTEKMEVEIYKKIARNNDIKSNNIFNEKIHCFNYYPLGARNVATLPKGYKDLFGFEFKKKQDGYAYFDKCTIRTKILQNFINDYIISNNKKLIVFGKSIWDKVETNILSEIGITMTLHDNGNIKYKISDKEKILFLKHPSYRHLTVKMVNEIFQKESITEGTNTI